MFRRLLLTCVLAAAMLVGLMVMVATADGPIVDLDAGEEDFRIVGVNTLDWLGEVASGDINGDGIDDLIVGTSGTDLINPARYNAGAAYVIWGTSDGLSGTLDVDSSSPDLMVYAPGAYFGFGRYVTSGDINGDGIDDLMIGADYASVDGHRRNGAVYVLFGSSALSGTFDLSVHRAGLTVYGAATYDHLGRAIAVCDVNADAVADLIVGAYQYDKIGTRIYQDGPGIVHVFFGSTGLSGTIELDSSDANFTLWGNDDGDRLGRSVACGDVDGDGIADIIAGAYGADSPWGDNTGAVYVVYGDKTLSGTLDLDSGDPDVLLRGGSELGAAGTGFCVASGDVNGDGLGDFLIGAYLENVNHTGSAYLVYGSESLPATVNLSETADVTIYGEARDNRFSRSLSSGDFNGDGYDDILVGSSWADMVRDGQMVMDTGTSYVIYGASEIVSTIYLSDTDLVAIQVLGDDAEDEAGRSSGSGDLNGDGADDLIVGASLALGTSSGEAYVIHGSKATALTLSPVSTDITAGQLVTFTATASNLFGDWDITGRTVFTIAQVARGAWSDNVYTSENAGTWIITGVFQSLVATATLTVNHADPERVELTPDAVTRTAGQSISLVLTAYDIYDNPWEVTADADYMITPGAGGEWVTNVYTSEVAGTWTVTGTYYGEWDTVTLAVNHASLDRLDLVPDTETCMAGQSVSYTLTAYDVHNNLWEVTASADYATSLGAGGEWEINVYTSEVAGTWTVTGTHSGKWDTAVLTIEPNPTGKTSLARLWLRFLEWLVSLFE